MESEAIQETDQKLPKNCKETRYYYRNRDRILEKRRQKRLEDPEYQAKQKQKEDAKKAKEEEKLIKLKEKLKAKEEALKVTEEEKRMQKGERCREKAKKKAELLGVLPVISSGVN